jgi:hypothetical protein
MAWGDETLRAAMKAYVKAVEDAVETSEQTLVAGDPDYLHKANEHLLETVRKEEPNLAARAEVMMEAVMAAGDSPPRLRDVRRQLDQVASDMRALLGAYFRFLRLRLAEINARSRADYLEWHVTDATMRIHAIQGRQTFRALGIPEVDLRRSPKVHAAHWETIRRNRRLSRKLGYGALWSAFKLYVYWSSRSFARFAITYIVEFVAAVLLLGLGVEALITHTIISSISVVWVILITIIAEVLKRWVIDPWMEHRFFDWRRRTLVTSIRQFHYEALRTHGMLAIADSLDAKYTPKIHPSPDLEP